MIIRKMSVVLLSVFLVVVALIPSPVRAAAERSSITFSGYTWNIRHGQRSNPGPNVWNGSERAVFVDSQGQLHLKVINTNSIWSSSEVFLPSSLGYGTYTFEISEGGVYNPAFLDQNVVASPFLYQDDTHEYDIEFSNWQSPGDDQGQFVVQPGYIDGQGPVKGNVSRFPLTTSGATSTHTMTWTPESIAFKSTQNGKTLNSWSNSGPNFFTPGGEKLHINLWLIDGAAPTNGQEQEFIVKSFTFTPLQTAMPTARLASTAVQPTSTLVKTACTKSDVNDPCRAVYYVDQDNQRHAFPNESTYFDWYEDFNGITIVSKEAMASYPLVKMVGYRPDSLVRFTTSKVVYGVGDNGDLRAIPDEATAQTLFGSRWSDRVHVMSDAFFSGYAVGQGLNSDYVSFSTGHFITLADLYSSSL